MAARPRASVRASTGKSLTCALPRSSAGRSSVTAAMVLFLRRWGWCNLGSGGLGIVAARPGRSGSRSPDAQSGVVTGRPAFDDSE